MGYPFVQARNYTRTTGRHVSLIVIHSMEAPETWGRARNTANWFAGRTAPRASAHYCVDNTEVIQCVREIDVAWHAPGANHNGIGIEHSGYARQSLAEWQDPYSAAMLALSARLSAGIAARFGIPARFLNAHDLRRGDTNGVTTHHEVSQAYRRSDHWDPGPHFPMAHYLNMMRGAPAPSPMPRPSPVVIGQSSLRRNSRGDEVVAWQKILVGASLLPASKVNGVFDAATESATRKFQAQLKIAVDGIVGPETRTATARLLAWLAATNKKPSRGGPAPRFSGYVKRGSVGEIVRRVQDRLRDRGWRIAVDGHFGKETERVVRAFQTEKRLTPDGIVGPQTWAALWTTPIT